MGIVTFPFSLKVVIFTLLKKKKTSRKAFDRFIPSATATTAIVIPPKLSTSLFSVCDATRKDSPVSLDS